MDARVEIVHLARWVAAGQSVFPGGVGEVHKPDSAAGVGRDLRIVIIRVFRQFFGKAQDVLNQVCIEVWLFALCGDSAAGVERGPHQLIKRLTEKRLGHADGVGRV